MNKIIYLLLMFVMISAQAHSAILVFSPNGSYSMPVAQTIAAVAADPSTAGKHIVNTTHGAVISTAVVLSGGRTFENMNGGTIALTGSGSLTGLSYAIPAWFTSSQYNNALAATRFVDTQSPGYVYKEQTYGTYETAVASSITANAGVGQAKENTQVLGTNTVGLAQSYTDRDHVAQYISSYSFTPMVAGTSTTYSATTINNSIFATYSANKIKPGMIIDTLHATPYTSRVVSWVNGSTTVVVDAWYLQSGGGATTPANGTGAMVNPNSKIFGQNIVVSAKGNGTTTGAQKFSGVELDLSTSTSGSPVSGTWGYDMAVTSGYLDVGYQIRGTRNIGFYSNNAGGAALYGFRSDGDGRAVTINDATVNAIEVNQSSVNKFAVNPSGNVMAQGINLGLTKQTGSVATQCSTSFVSIGTVPSNGSLFWITGFNVSGGAEGSFLLMVRSGTVVAVSSSDNSSLGITFQAVGRQLQIKTTSGTFQFYYYQLSA